MTLLHDAYTALLSGLTHRTCNEIHWHDKDGNPITVEPVDVESCIYRVRRYYEDGSLDLEMNYRQNQPHGKSVWWYRNGQKWWETDYVNGQIHGRDIMWYVNGQIHCEVDYYQNQPHGKSINWHTNGQKRREVDYRKGKRYGKYVLWYESGTLDYEHYYIDDQQVTREEWEQHNDATT